jgi:hypothetical protein
LTINDPLEKYQDRNKVYPTANKSEEGAKSPLTISFFWPHSSRPKTHAPFDIILVKPTYTTMNFSQDGIGLPESTASSIGGDVGTGMKSEENVIVPLAGDAGRLQDALEAWEEMGALSRDVGAFLIEAQSYSLKNTLATQQCPTKKRDMDVSLHSEKEPKLHKLTLKEEEEAPQDEGIKHQVHRIKKMSSLLESLNKTHSELREEVQSMLYESQSSLQVEDNNDGEDLCDPED